ncbi:hypothetical protein Bca4012_085853 [Brassica carinata]
MQFVRSVAAQCCRRGKPVGRRNFSSSPRPSLHNECKGMANGTPPEKPVVQLGSPAPGLAVFFGFSGYMIWQMVENIRITKTMKKCTEYYKESSLRNHRVSEGYEEMGRVVAAEAKAETELKAEPEAKPEAIPETIPEAGKKAEEDMEMPWWCGSA